MDKSEAIDILYDWNYWDKEPPSTVVREQYDEKIIRLKQKSLEEHFGDYLDLKQRNRYITNAIKDGYKQSEIGRYLGLSSAGISYILNQNTEK